MSLESAKLFIERIKSDEAFAKKISEHKDAEACVAFVNDAGYDFTAEEIEEARGALSEEELDAVAGGQGMNEMQLQKLQARNMGSYIMVNNLLKQINDSISSIVSQVH